MLRGMRVPAQVAGGVGWQDFLERGFRAFRQMKDSKHFLDAIQGRETQILDRIHRGTARPFDLDETGG